MKVDELLKELAEQGERQTRQTAGIKSSFKSKLDLVDVGISKQLSSEAQRATASSPRRGDELAELLGQLAAVRPQPAQLCLGLGVDCRDGLVRSSCSRPAWSRTFSKGEGRQRLTAAAAPLCPHGVLARQALARQRGGKARCMMMEGRRSSFLPFPTRQIMLFGSLLCTVGASYSAKYGFGRARPATVTSLGP
jgi:hypothetical protein